MTDGGDVVIVVNVVDGGDVVIDDRRWSTVAMWSSMIDGGRRWRCGHRRSSWSTVAMWSSMIDGGRRWRCGHRRSSMIDGGDVVIVVNVVDGGDVVIDDRGWSTVVDGGAVVIGDHR
jgi:hypothetical protein